MKRQRRLEMFSIILVLSVFLPVVSGCATSRTTRTETTVTEDNPSAGINGNDGVVTETTTTTETTKQEEPRGLVGSTLHFIGQVIAFPFKVIGHVFDFIF